ncbi:MAG TPA: PLP-dependent aspartate aminotransferase family protein [Alphaproteobacteria bacterium]|nr:PLP-dependent aspartate aminotransferase family protein [Alphaproteobacteria bacterium]
MKIDTVAVHAGNHPDRQLGAVSPPIYQTVTFAAPDTAALMAINRGERQGFVYSRLRNPTVMALEEKLARLEGAESAVAFSSGMAATAAAVGACLKAGDEMVSLADVYGGTHHYFSEILPRHGIKVNWCDSHDPGRIEAAITPATRVVFVETPTNPLLRIVDLRAVAEVARRNAVTLIVDGTLGSPLNQRPLELGADLVVHSASKYLNGHSDVIVGAVAGARAHTRAVRHLQFVAGPILEPLAAWLVHRGLSTYALRIRQHNENGTALAGFLEAHPKVERVHYPGLESHPQHALATRQMRGFGGLLSFEVRGDGDAARRLVDRCKLCRLGPSLGGIESLISQPIATSHYSVPAATRLALGIPDNLVRLSVGIEAAEDIVADLAQALEAV